MVRFCFCRVDPSPIPQYRNTSSTIKEYLGGEDDFLWQDLGSGSFHVVFHDMEGTCGGADNEYGCHAFSADGYSWYLSPGYVYNSTISYVGGKVKHVSRRERPVIVFDDEGNPTHLLTSNQDDDDDDHTYTHIQPVHTGSTTQRQ
jgi:hypothetical protein